MADIAFLLLIFFLVTTTIDTEKGLGIVLPAEGQELEIKKQNILNCLINSSGKVLLGKEPIEIQNISKEVKRQLQENSKLIISVKAHGQAKYADYVRVIDQIKNGQRNPYIHRKYRIMKFNKKTKLSSEIPTASMPDIIFMLLVFFMVTTVLREYAGLNVNLPKAKRIEKLEGKRHIAHVWISKDGLVSIEDKIYAMNNVRDVMYDKRAGDPQITVSLKADMSAKMENISALHSELRKADALKLNYSAKLEVD